MPISVAEYLRHLAVRCSRMARDCYDSTVAKELESLSCELVEKAEEAEAQLRIRPDAPEVQDRQDIGICSDEDGAA